MEIILLDPVNLKLLTVTLFKLFLKKSFLVAWTITSFSIYLWIIVLILDHVFNSIFVHNPKSFSFLSEVKESRKYSHLSWSQLISSSIIKVVAALFVVQLLSQLSLHYVLTLIDGQLSD